MIRSLTVLGCLFVSLASCGKTDKSVDDLLLSNGWKVQSSAKVHCSGEQLSKPAVATKGWYDASVPSTIMGVLTKNGLYKDAFEGMNYKKIDQSIFDTTWWYRKEFVLSDVSKNKHISLLFDGISYAANIWLNGKLIATRDSIHGSFRRFNLDVTNVIAKKNVLAIEVYRAQPGEPNIGFVDWNPRPSDESMGIFREVRVLLNNDVAIQHAMVQSKVNTKTLDEAWLTVETQLNNMSGQPIKGYLEGRMEGQTFSIPVALGAKEKRIIKVTPNEVNWLHMKNPRLWWCRNMGKPEMYQMSLSFVQNKEVSDKDTINFGVREIKDYYTKENYRGFLLNGKEVLVRGAGWTDDLFLRDTPQTNEMQVQYVCDMNMNTIRFENIWGTSENIYDLCDRYGLLALVGWSCHWEWENYLGTPCDDFGGIKSEKDMTLINQSLRDQVLWLRNHPSIIAWFVGSDMLPRPELEGKYQKTFKEIDNRPWISAAKEFVSKLTGPTGTKMAGPYDYVAPNYWYAKEAQGGAFGFNTETGIGAQLPVIESLKKFIPADKLWPLNEHWNYHCTTAMNTLDVLKSCAEARYGKVENLNDFLKKADLMNYEGTRAMFEAFRVNIPRTTGIIQWMLNSAWPSMYWQLYDYYMIPTSAYYSVKKSNMTQQLIYNYGDHKVYAVNEGLKAKKISGKMMMYDLNGKCLTNQKITLTVSPYSVVEAFKVPDIADVAFLCLQLTEEQGKRITDNFYTLSASPDEHDWAKSDWMRTPIKKSADFSKLTQMSEAQCALNATVKKEQGQTIIELKLNNQSTVLAFFVRLSLKDEHGNLIYPIFWDDNYLSLLPGEHRTMKAMIPNNVKLPKQATLSLSGWNVAEQSIHLSF